MGMMVQSAATPNHIQGSVEPGCSRPVQSPTQRTSCCSQGMWVCAARPLLPPLPFLPAGQAAAGRAVERALRRACPSLCCHKSSVRRMAGGLAGWRVGWLARHTPCLCCHRSSIWRLVSGLAGWLVGAAHPLLHPPLWREAQGARVRQQRGVEAAHAGARRVVEAAPQACQHGRVWRGGGPAWGAAVWKCESLRGARGAQANSWWGASGVTGRGAPLHAAQQHGSAGRRGGLRGAWQHGGARP